MTLKAFFTQHPRAALAFSGGTDSAYLMWAAKQNGCQVHAYFAKSAFQPAFELEDARRLAAQLDVPLTVIALDVLADETVTQNPPDRCYHCKKRVFSALLDAARQDGFDLMMDGTNASDDAGDRPGMRALKEMQVCSPLRLCGLTKPQIRALSKEAGLFTWNKPAYACLATRVPQGTPIDADKLEKIERAESSLFSLGFTDFRVRLLGKAARIQLPASQMNSALAQRQALLEGLQPDFTDILLDLVARPE
nr:ATP-dependent sacrificial sulfur transferase LarE [bacterium]